MPPTVDLEKCTGCGDCYDVCPLEPNTFEIKDKKSIVVSPESCIECGSCESSCPEAAITLE